MRAPRYRFHYGQPSNFVEIYLPKKAAYQGALYDTLKKGFDLVKVRDHLLKNGVAQRVPNTKELSVPTSKSRTVAVVQQVFVGLAMACFGIL